MYDQDTYEMVMCRVCGYTCATLSSHLKNKHGLNTAGYKESFPGATVVSQERLDKLRANSISKTPEFRQSMSERVKGENHPLYGKEVSEKTRKALSERMSGANNPAYGKTVDENFVKRTRRGALLHNKPHLAEKTTLEYTCEVLLKGFGEEYTYKMKTGSFVCDFAIRCGNHIKIIEVMEDHEEGNPTVYSVFSVAQKRAMQKEAEKREYLKGTPILYLWESDLLGRPDACNDLIEVFLDGYTRDIIHSYEFRRGSTYVSDAEGTTRGNS